MLEVLFGHCTYAALVRRPVLSVFHCMYWFILAERGRQVALWPSVVEELRVFRGLMPFLSSDWWLRWNLLVSASVVSRPTVMGCRPRCGRMKRSVKLDERDHDCRAVSARVHAMGLLALVMGSLFLRKTTTWQSRRPRSLCTGTLRSTGSWESTLTFPRWRRLDLPFRGGFSRISFRSLAKVKRRGGWKQDKSVARYEKGSRLGFSAQQHPTMLIVHGDECEKRPDDILIHRRTVVPPTGLGTMQSRRGAASQV